MTTTEEIREVATMKPHRLGEMFRRSSLDAAVDLPCEMFFHRFSLQGVDLGGEREHIGVVAQITEFSTSKCAVAWIGGENHGTVDVFDDLAAVFAAHGGGGKTVIYWQDGSVQVSADDCTIP